MHSTPDAQPAIDIDNLSVSYQVQQARDASHDTAPWRRLIPQQHVNVTIQALQAVSFAVRPGSVTGVIGHNGAGKTTLMRVIAGIIPPGKGRVTIRGDVTVMMALGVGMNRQLTGRENIRLGCLAGGLTRTQIAERFDEIVAFAELEDRIDQPIRTYSSGMRSRLGFSVAAHIRPDILLMDEALATGDAAFREKSMDRVEQLCADASTIVLASHTLPTVRRLADQVIWMHRGQVRHAGDPEEVCTAYAEHARQTR